MPHSDFIHLHLHTQYSLLDGACRIPDILHLANQYKMDSLAITDHGNMFGAIEFYLAAQKAGIKPIIGCEVYVAPKSRLDKTSRGIEDASYHFILLVKDETGYQNLMKLVSIGYLEGFYYRPRIDKEVLSLYKEGLIGLTACLKGEIALLLQQLRFNDALKATDEFLNIFGKDNFYLEIQENNIAEQKIVNQGLIKISKELNIPLVATNDVHYVAQDKARAHEALLCIQTQTTLNDPNRLRFQTDEFYFKSPQQMKELFKEVPEAVANTLEIAQRCNLELDFSQVHLPKYELPEGKGKDEFLKELCEECIKKKYSDVTPAIKDRLGHELKIIKDMGFTSYFLIVWDFIHYAKNNRIPVGPGRGCLLPDTKILTKDGKQIDIQDIKTGDYVISHTGRANRVKNLFIYDVMEDIVTVKAKMPIFELKLTSDHKVLAIRHKMCNVKSMKPTICKPTCRRYCKNKLWQEYKPEWIKSSELEKNNFLLYPKPKITLRRKFYLFDLAKIIRDKVNFKYDSKSVWYEFGSNKIIQKRINRFVKLDEKLARLLGYYVSEGWSRTKKRESLMGFGFGKHEEDKCREVQDLLKRIFDLDSKIIAHKKRNSFQVISYSKIVGEFCEMLCGKYSENKRVPEQIFNSPEEIKIEFLTGAFLGDGSNKEGMRISYDSVSCNLVSQIKMLLASLGIMSSINIRSYSNSQWHDSFKLRISGKQLFYFNKIFKDFIANIKQQDFYRNDTFIDENYIYFPVQDISFQRYKGKVYDISVDRDKTYVSNEVAVHNSAAGSLVSYLLGITDIDPLKYSLLFERFLNPERLSLPDIDIDFCYERRQEVIDYVTRKYGQENVSQIITFGTMQARAVVRDVGRVMGLAYADVDHIAKLIPPTDSANPNFTLKDALVSEPELNNLYKTDSQIKNLIDIALSLEGLNRHASTHAAGVVIADKPLDNYMPLFRTQEDQITSGYDMGALEKIGLLKVDFLGLRTLTVIDQTVKLIKETKRQEIDIENLPLDDSNTYRLLASAQTIGVFQLESSGMRDLLKKLDPSRFEDLIALLALYRPGPMGSGMLDDFIKRKKGMIPLKYDHKKLEPILKDTYGIMLYQEQIMHIASELAGFSLSQADLLRRAMSKKIPEVMEQQRKNFVSGCIKNGVNFSIANKIFDQIVYFSGYGFNRSHSTAYALISFRTAYLKANYPVEFMTALLTSERDNTDKIVEYINEAERMGIEILPPDINESVGFFKVEAKLKIRYGFLAIKNVGRGAVESLIKSRKESGRFSSLEDLCRRIDLRLFNRKVLESIIKCGVLDSFGLHRSTMFASLDNILECASRIQKEKATGQISFFDEALSKNGFQESLNANPEIKEWPEPQLLAFEKELLGFYISGHPLARYAKLLKRFSSSPINDLSKYNDQDTVKIVGLITKIKHTTTRQKQEKMAILKLEDLEGIIEVLVFPSTFQKVSKYIQPSNVVLLRGRLDLKENTPKIIASDLFPIDEVYRIITSVNINLSGLRENLFESLKELLSSSPGQTPVYLHLDTPTKSRIQLIVGNELFIQPSEKLIQDIENLLGEDRISLSI